MKYIERIVQILMLVAIIMLCYSTVKAENIQINWYDSPISKDKSILEVCFDNDECHKLIHKNESINKDVILKWVDEIKLIRNKLKETNKKFKKEK